MTINKIKYLRYFFEVAFEVQIVFLFEFKFKSFWCLILSKFDTAYL
jgi:hypothetical protein